MIEKRGFGEPKEYPSHKKGKPHRNLWWKSKESIANVSPMQIGKGTLCASRYSQLALWRLSPFARKELSRFSGKFPTAQAGFSGRLKGQTSMIAILLIVVLFMGILMFLFSSTEVLRNEDYVKNQGTLILTSLLRTDTGNPGAPDKCKTVADVIHCSIKTPSWTCGSSDCGDLAEPLVDLYLKNIVDPKLDYYLTYEDVEIYSDKSILNRTKGPGVNKVTQKISKSFAGDVDVELYVVPA